MNQSDTTRIIQVTQAWLQHAVIGLNLCPFAKSVYVKNQIEYQLSTASDENILLDELKLALIKLIETPASTIDTSLLIHPYVLHDFLDYNDFLYQADDLMHDLKLDGVLQIASFYPDYQFADENKEDMSHCTNRSPYPMLHLLREDSLDQAISAKPEWEEIVANNIATMNNLGQKGWEELQKKIHK
jgi:uncharacterized protein